MFWSTMVNVCLTVIYLLIIQLLSERLQRTGQGIPLFMSGHIKGGWSMVVVESALLNAMVGYLHDKVF